MKEKFLHYVWQHKLLVPKLLNTRSNERVILVEQGIYNENSGPDFLNAKIKIAGQIWVGNIEIHLKSSDWYAHNHEKDIRYEAVILHVVWEDNVTVFMKNNKPLPTLELHDKVFENVMINYRKFWTEKLKWISCETQISSTNTFILNAWLERLYLSRLEDKSIQIKELLSKSNNDFEAVLFQMLCKSFGLKVNGTAFLEMAQSFSFSLLRKVQHNETTLSALLYGQAGLLEATVENEYYLYLKKEYQYLQHKYNLVPLLEKSFQFFRMRPNNFPTIRIAQLIALYTEHQSLFTKLMKIDKIEDYYKLFNLEVNDFWREHYTFTTSSKKTSKKLTTSFISLILINTILPLKFVYYQNKGINHYEDIFMMMRLLKPEKNNIISNFSTLGITADNALETQGLLHLKNNFCDKLKCLDCAVGNYIMRK